MTTNTTITVVDAQNVHLRVHAQGSVIEEFEFFEEDDVTPIDLSTRDVYIKIDGITVDNIPVADGGVPAPINKQLVPNVSNPTGMLLRLSAADISNIPLRTPKNYAIVDQTDPEYPTVVLSGTITLFGHKFNDGTDE
jgi:hypothetical protein